jgi:excisionase family DNA binding protein
MPQEITVREAVQLTGFSRQHIYNLIINGRLAARKLGHEYRLDPKVLAEYQTAQRKRRP